MSTNLMVFLDTNGDGTGTKNMAADYSGSPATPFYYTVPAGKTLDLYRAIIHIEDTNGVTAAGYGTGSALTNGIQFGIYDASSPAALELDLLDGIPVKTNAMWGAFCYDWTFHNFTSGDEFVVVRWTFAKAGKPLKLTAGKSVRCYVQDNLSVLVDHYINIQGILYDTGF